MGTDGPTRHQQRKTLYGNRLHLSSSRLAEYAAIAMFVALGGFEPMRGP